MSQSANPSDADALVSPWASGRATWPMIQAGVAVLSEFVPLEATSPVLPETDIVEKIFEAMLAARDLQKEPE